ESVGVIKVPHLLKSLLVKRDGMVVLVVFEKPPLLNGVEPRLDQRHIRECAAIECIDERFRIADARHVVEESAGYQNLPLEIRDSVGKVDKKMCRRRAIGLRRTGSLRRRAARPWLLPALGLETGRTRPHS